MGPIQGGQTGAAGDGAEAGLEISYLECRSEVHLRDRVGEGMENKYAYNVSQASA